ncbi:MAG: hypothetical protein LUE99_06535 [Bacteroides sp.]|nr:hypothetical protein [Bacteroides sp.]
MRFYKDAYYLAFDNSLSEQQIICIGFIINLACDLGHYSEAIHLFRGVDADSMVSSDNLTFSTLSLCYLQLQQPDSARLYLSKMNENSRVSGGLVFYCQMADTYIAENNEDSAAFYLNKAIRKIEKQKKQTPEAPLPRYIMPTYSAYASLLLQNGKIKQAGEAFRFVEPLMKMPVEEPDRLKKQIGALYRYSSFCRATKQYAKATDLLIYRDSILDIYNSTKEIREAKNWGGRYEIQKLLYENEKQKIDINNSKRLSALSWTFSCILIGIVAICVYISRCMNKKRHCWKND